MKRIAITTLVTLMAMMECMAADTLTIRQVFTDMPDSIIPYLTRNNRLDFIDFMDSNMKAEVTTEVGGKSLMTALTDDSLSIRLNDAARVDMLLAAPRQPADTKAVICLVRTIGVGEEWSESYVEYYSPRRERLDRVPELEAVDKERLSLLTKPLNIIETIRKKLNKN